MTSKRAPKANGQAGAAGRGWPAPTILGNVREVPLGQIRPDPDQPRQSIDPDELALLADTIRARGLLQPIRVRKMGGDDHLYVIIAGERRWHAAQMAGMSKIPCVIVVGDDDPIETLLDQVAENTGRLALEPLEEARAFQRILESRGWTQGQLAAQVGVGQSDVSKRLALLRLPEEVQDLVTSGDLDASTAYEVSRLTDDWEAIDVATLAVTWDWTRAQVADLVRLPEELRTRVRAGELTIARAVTAAKEPPPPVPSAPGMDVGTAATPAAGAPPEPPAGPGIGQAGAPGKFEAGAIRIVPVAPATIPGESPGPSIAAEPRDLEQLCDRIDRQDADLRDRGAHVLTVLLEPDDHHVTIVTGHDPETPTLVTVTSNGEGHPTIARALWLALGEALRAWPEEWARCNRCNAARPLGEHPCRECGCMEFRIELVGGDQSRGEG